MLSAHKTQIPTKIRLPWQWHKLFYCHVTWWVSKVLAAGRVLKQPKAPSGRKHYSSRLEKECQVLQQKYNDLDRIWTYDLYNTHVLCYHWAIYCGTQCSDNGCMGSPTVLLWKWVSNMFMRPERQMVSAKHHSQSSLLLPSWSKSLNFHANIYHPPYNLPTASPPLTTLKQLMYLKSWLLNLL